MEAEALLALQSGELAKSFITSISWVWWIIMIGVPIFGMLIYRYFLTALVDTFILFISNNSWSDKGKLVEINGERWVLDKVSLFRVYLTKLVILTNRGTKEKMIKTLIIPVGKYLASSLIFYDYPGTYSEENPESKIINLEERLNSLEKIIDRRKST